MLPIQPFVPQDKQTFHLEYCKLAEFLKAKNLNDYLVVTSPGSYLSCYHKLPGRHRCVHVYNTKVDELDRLQELYKQTLIEQKEFAADGRLETGYVQSAPSLDMDGVFAVVSLGGGVAMDAGKYIATRYKKPLYAVPTALSVNAGFCYKAALRRRDKDNPAAYNVEYERMDLPVAICIDFDVIRGVGQPESTRKFLRKLNVAGAGDLLSCITASFDWKLNSLAARDMKVVNRYDELVSLEKPFSQEVCNGAMELMGLLSENIDDIREGTEKGVRFLCDAYQWVAEQSVVMNHTMWESASEHGMFDYMENLCGKEFTHGQVIGLGVYFMSRLQRNQHERAVSMIKRLGLDITLNDLTVAPPKSPEDKIGAADLYRCLKGLRAYIKAISYRYTIISARDITEEWILDALDAYYRDFPDQEAARQHADPAYRAKYYTA